MRDVIKCGINWIKFWNSWRNFGFTVFNFYLKLKSIFLVSSFTFKLFAFGHIHNVVSTLVNVVKLDIENVNVVLNLPNVVNNNVEIYNVDTALFNIANFKVDVRNVVLTLIWCCPTLLRHINIATTLKQRWNVSWYKL